MHAHVEEAGKFQLLNEIPRNCILFLAIFMKNLHFIFSNFYEKQKMHSFLIVQPGFTQNGSTIRFIIQPAVFIIQPAVFIIQPAVFIIQPACSILNKIVTDG